jgi:Family of unknown function (DUF5723)
MKKMVVFFFCLHGFQSLSAQQNLGIRNSNYAGIQGVLLNPSSIAGSKLNWDVNVLSVGEVFDNTFLFAPRSSLNFLGVGRIIRGSIHEDLFYTNYDPQQPNKLYNLTLSTEILGPSFFMKIKKKYSIGFTFSERSYANIKNITGNLAQNAYVYFLDKSLWNTDLQDSTTRINAMSWFTYGLHFATVLYSQGRDELKGGISLNFLQGVAAAYATNTRLNYRINDTSSISFTHSNLDYGRTSIDDYKNINNYNDLNHGYGFGMDIGFTYVRLKTAEPEKQDYIYRIGISLIDIGHINFDRNSASYHLQADTADLSNWHHLRFSGNNQFDQTLSAAFYQGDSTKSLTAQHFNMSMPSAISIQADWNVYKQFFANLTIVQGFGHGIHPGVQRPDVYSLTPRYETLWGEVSIPMSLLYYNQWRSRLGIAFRVYYFYFGGDAPGSLFKLRDLEGVDFYAGVHFFIPEIKNPAKQSNVTK